MDQIRAWLASYLGLHLHMRMRDGHHMQASHGHELVALAPLGHGPPHHRDEHNRHYGGPDEQNDRRGAVGAVTVRGEVPHEDRGDEQQRRADDEAVQGGVEPCSRHRLHVEAVLAEGRPALWFQSCLHVQDAHWLIVSRLCL